MAGLFNANQGFLFTNILQIPNLFQAPYETMSRIGFILLSILFIVAILHENFQALKNQSDYSGLFIRVILVVGLLVIYERFFIWVVYGMDLAANAVLPHEEFQEVIKAFLTQPLTWKTAWKFDLRLTATMLNYITYAIACALFGAIMMLRFALLSFLYVIGPIVISIGIYKGTSQGLTAWLKSLIAISAWNVILSILMKVISVMNLTAIYLTDETNFLTILAANVLFIALFVLVPLLSNQFVSGSNLSGLGSIVLGAFTAVVTRVLIRPMFQQPKPGKSNPQAGGSSYK
ncbi:MAG: hypothetical protein A3G33_08270 [Omnitrophica bacterium RIFCSPLOWO2_12_FULL_44_17]|uniref:Type IV secretion system protein n=1 Tax=Candidatus Danuiimicrobium aquiferis TaxID=1801832 RepID=A0A1G1KX37_9BACT|nr:MAG: hypothetical protein A3B72_03485 [Omnitrophica bacterium RIFCSPHIGHO2_02_FULL_45_28]OGW90519.1 MAG: hypothetical protein A3E74_03010 [Omnitrophica bacterium RIFCSPHIGHO2_12_FULL_44_12]OGW97159.1 MAG: hypothetical protein A3G33_08270 [Omnitrophica bacterium RIFCSPLOWO2_12_FULL_44_17]OGX02219.1 MAG: hypothetical protein A3J12_08045 [Omnitrophica bacterium RIFCSPLOWO2_02_FULL_44_11]